jgi:hypothetical protein
MCAELAPIAVLAICIEGTHRKQHFQASATMLSPREGLFLKRAFQEEYYAKMTGFNRLRRGLRNANG